MSHREEKINLRDINKMNLNETILIFKVVYFMCFIIDYLDILSESLSEIYDMKDASQSFLLIFLIRFYIFHFTILYSLMVITLLSIQLEIQ